MPTSRVRSICLLTVLLLVSTGALLARQRSELDFRTAPHVTLGYTVNAPKQLLGFAGMAFAPQFKDWGIYADAKFTLDSPAEERGFDPTLSPGQADGFGDLFLETRSDWTTVNIGIMRVLSGSLAVYAGGGYSREAVYRRYYDDTATRGLFGTYWVEDDVGSGTRLNILGGAVFRVARSVVFQFGLESAPRGVTVGAAYVLPFLR